MKLFFILGNQLFPLKYVDCFKKDHLFFMAEDLGLCTYEKHHKHKILLFLSSMRSYADELYKNKYNLKYYKISDNIECVENLRAISIARLWHFYLYTYDLSTSSSLTTLKRSLILR